jgi:hypothetical protein
MNRYESIRDLEIEFEGNIPDRSVRFLGFSKTEVLAWEAHPKLGRYLILFKAMKDYDLQGNFFPKEANAVRIIVDPALKIFDENHRRVNVFAYQFCRVPDKYKIQRKEKTFSDSDESSSSSEDNPGNHGQVCPCTNFSLGRI